VKVLANFTPDSPLLNPAVEYYVEFENGWETQNTPAKAKKEPMKPTPMGYMALLPAQKGRSVVRYRIVGERTPGTVEAITPRPTDPIPYGFYSYFVGLQIGGKPHYEIFLTRKDWTQLWINSAGSLTSITNKPYHNDGCNESPTWNARVPGLLAFQGKLFDLRMRYSGSTNGRLPTSNIENWPSTAPKPDGPLKAVGLSLAFPRYGKFEKRRRAVLNRLSQSCPGFQHYIVHALSEDDKEKEKGRDIPASMLRRWARVYVNGGLYSYAMDIDPIGEEILERFHGKGKLVGDLFKTRGNGPTVANGMADGVVFGSAGGSPIPNGCVPAKVRYAATFSRVTHEHRGHDDLIKLIEGMAAAKGKGSAALRTFMSEHFDMNRMLQHFAIQIWGAAWDDMHKNFAVYQLPPQSRKPGNQGWMIIPWDSDWTFGVSASGDRFYCRTGDCGRAETSVYCGGEGHTASAAQVQRDPAIGVLQKCNTWKGSIIDTMQGVFRTEYAERLKELNESLLKPERMQALIAKMEATGGFDVNEAMMASSQKRCDWATHLAGVKVFPRARYLSVKQQLKY
jgi:hypothetical protein